MVRPWNRLPKEDVEAMDAISLKAFKVRTDEALSSLIRCVATLPVTDRLELDDL